jgi:GDP-4-dehydro-6-deoxy-D-mannose reductase
VLVTGAGGFAGSHLAEHLLQQGERVVAMVSTRGTLTNLQSIVDRIKVERIDLADSARLRGVLGDYRPERIYHLASVSTKFELPGEFWLPFESILKGTVNLLHAWRESGIRARMLYVSSAEIYGAAAGIPMPLREDSCFAPSSLYASSKVAAEMFCLQFFRSYGLPIVRVRPFQHTGPRQSAAFVCSNFARQFAEIARGLRDPRITVGNVHVWRDFTDVRDIVRGYRLLLENGEPGEAYQLCSGRAVSISSLLEILCRLSAIIVEMATDDTKVRSDEVAAYWGDPSKASHAVGWSAQIPMENTLRDLKTHWETVLAGETAAAVGS